MFLLNISELLKGRGIEQPAKFLMAHGLPYHTVNRLLTNKVQNVTYATIEKLCLVCTCTPDDLFVWRKDDATTVADDHPLHKLQPKVAVASPVDRIKKLPLAKLKKLQELLDGLEKE